MSGEHIRTTPSRPKRPAVRPIGDSQRSRITNDPLHLPGAPDGTTAEGRRWRDLVRYYRNELGDERFFDERNRVLLTSLISATLGVERLQAVIARNPDFSKEDQGRAERLTYQVTHLMGLLFPEEKQAPDSEGRDAEDAASFLEEAAPRPLLEGQALTGQLGQALIRAGAITTDGFLVRHGQPTTRREEVLAEERQRAEEAASAILVASDFMTAFADNCSSLSREWWNHLRQLALLGSLSGARAIPSWPEGAGRPAYPAVATEIDTENRAASLGYVSPPDVDWRPETPPSASEEDVSGEQSEVDDWEPTEGGRFPELKDCPRPEDVDLDPDTPPQQVMRELHARRRREAAHEEFLRLMRFGGFRISTR